MVGHWGAMHKGQEPAPYGDTETYELAAAWLNDCSVVEDWGCGLGWARRYFYPDQHYVGLDGSPGPNVDMVVDLTTYQSQTPGLLLRHVLEHNPEWPLILDNALASFTERMVLILFTPMAEETSVIAWNYGYEVPDISFRAEDLEEHFPEDVEFHVQDLHTKSFYGVERIYYLERVDGHQEAEALEVQEGRPPQATRRPGQDEDPGEEDGRRQIWQTGAESEEASALRQERPHRRTAQKETMTMSVSEEAGPAPGGAGRGQGLSIVSTRRGVGSGGGKGLSALSAAKNAPGKSSKRGLSAVSSTPSSPGKSGGKGGGPA